MPAIIVPRRHLVQPQGRIEPASEYSSARVLALPGCVWSNKGILPARVPVQGENFGQSWVFNGASDFIDLGAQPAAYTSLTLGALVYQGTTVNAFPISSRQTAGQGVEILVGAGGVVGLATVRIESSGGGIPVAPATGMQTRFALHVITLSGGNVKHYVDGALISSTSGLTGTITSGQNLRLGLRAATYFAGRIGLAFEFPEGWSAERVADVSRNPWQLFRRDPVRLYFDVGGGGATSLVIQGATHGHAADVLTLTSSTALTVSDATHSHVADALTLSIGTALSVADSSHAHAAESLALTTDSALAIADALHAQAADNLTLTASGAASLTVQDASHSHSADALTLTTLSVLAVADASHAHTADNIDLSGAPSLAVQDATHGHTADGLALTLDAWLSINSAIHATRADNVVLSIPGGLLPPVRCTGTHTLSASITAVHGLAASVAASTRIASDVTTTVRPL